MSMVAQTPTIRPIETRYGGYRFRSRLEARWAVFFDAAGIKYEYEAQGFDVDGRRYLPDFWLPGLETFVEVKPTEEAAEQTKPLLRALAVSAKHRALLIIGSPNTVEPPKMVGFRASGHCYNSVWWLQCSYCNDVSIEIPHAPRCTKCSQLPGVRILFWPMLPSPRVDYAIEAGQQARFEHGEDPTPEPYTASVSTVRRRVYMAGAVVEETENKNGDGTRWVHREVLPWREQIYDIGEFDGLRAGEAEVGRFDYGGPTIIIDHGIGDHALASRCLGDVAQSDALFAWIDRTDTIGTLAEIGAAHAWRKPVFIAFASEVLASHFYFMRQLARAAVVARTATDAWRLFAGWQDRMDQ